MKSCVLFCPSKTWGGVEKNVLVRTRFLSEKNYLVYIVLLNGCFSKKFENIPNVKIINVRSRGGDFNFFVISNYVKILNKIKPSVVFVALKKDWFLVSVAAKIAKVPRTILYLGIRRTIKNNIKYRFVFFSLKPILTVNSDSLKQHLLNSTPFFNNQNLLKIYNGFVMPDINGDKTDLIKKLNLPQNTIIIGCAGRFSLQKGFDLIPDILANLPENIHIVHAGSHGGSEYTIKEIINNSPIKDRVHFLGYQDHMNLFYRSIDLFLLCSRFEGMANVLNEALSHGVPSVSTKVDGSIELLENGKYGILTEIEDTKALSLAIEKIITKKVTFDPQFLREHIQNEFSMEAMSNATEKLFFHPL